MGPYAYVFEVLSFGRERYCETAVLEVSADAGLLDGSAFARR